LGHKMATLGISASLGRDSVQIGFRKSPGVMIAFRRRILRQEGLAFIVAPLAAQGKADEGPTNEKVRKTYKEALDYSDRQFSGLSGAGKGASLAIVFGLGPAGLGTATEENSLSPCVPTQQFLNFCPLPKGPAIFRVGASAAEIRMASSTTLIYS
jgi:hypothetical protein